MDQDRRDAAAWAKEWYIRKKNRRLLIVLALLLLIAAVVCAVYFAVVNIERSTFRSVEDMRKAMQGRYAIERDYEDIIIEGDEITLTYLSYSHYDRDYAERYGYDYSGDDSVYEDHVIKWGFRNGVIKTKWMGDLVVDKNGNIRRGNRYYTTFYKTDKPRPEPIDPSTLNPPEESPEGEVPAGEEQAVEESGDSTEDAEDAAEDLTEDAGTEGEDNVQT